MQDSLSRIQAGLERLGRSVTVDALQPGLPAAETRSVLRAAGLPEDDQLEALFAWHDGTGAPWLTLGDIYIFPGFHLLSLQEAIDNYRAFLPDPRWRAGWLPVFADSGGDFYVVDLGGQPSGRVHHFRNEESEHPVEYLSLADMMATLAAGFDREVFFVDEHGYLEMDYLQFNALATELNPHVRWWTD